MKGEREDVRTALGLILNDLGLCFLKSIFQGLPSFMVNFHIDHCRKIPKSE